jgi:hypothetical protein
MKDAKTNSFHDSFLALSRGKGDLSVKLQASNEISPNSPHSLHTDRLTQ